MARERIIHLEPNDAVNAVAVLVDAFFEYPVMRYVLGEADRSYPDHIRALIGFFVESRFDVGAPVLGITHKTASNLVAVAVVDRPATHHAGQEERVRRLRDLIGDQAMTRLKSFADAIGPLEPTEGYYYLGMMGVIEKFRGRDLSRLLIEEIGAMSDQDPGSTGILLTTEDSGNLALYEALGFAVIGEAETPDKVLHSWTMFKPDRVV